MSAPGEPRFTAVTKVPGGFWLVACNECRAVIGVGDHDQKLHLEWHESLRRAVGQ